MSVRSNHSLKVIKKLKLRSNSSNVQRVCLWLWHVH